MVDFRAAMYVLRWAQPPLPLLRLALLMLRPRTPELGR